MSRGKFIPGGSSKKDRDAAPARTEPIRAPDGPSAGKRLFPRGAARTLGRPVPAGKKPAFTTIAAIICFLSVLLGGYFFAVRPAQRDAAAARKLAAQLKKDNDEKDKQNQALVKQAQEAEKQAAVPKTAGLFEVTSDPSGATVHVADRPVAKTPAQFKDLPVGTISVTVEADDYVSNTQEVTLDAGQASSVNVVLQPKPGQLNLTSALSDVEYTLTADADQSVSRGTVPAIVADLAKGHYTVQFRHKSWRLEPQKVEIAANKTTSLDAKFPYASLRIDYSPANAVIKQGKDTVGTGHSPLILSELRPTDFLFSFEAPGYQFQRVAISLRQGEQARRQIDLVKSDDFTTSFGMEMIEIPDLHIWVGKYEVTEGQYQAVMGMNPSSFRGNFKRPVEMVSWNDAVDFCKQATKLELSKGTIKPGYHLALPTERQWGVYVGDARLDLAAMSQNYSMTGTAEVGASEPNQFGLYDVLGNVMEWTADPFDSNNAKNRAVRGGNWLSSSTSFPSKDTRVSAAENYRDRFTGFRVVLEKD